MGDKTTTVGERANTERTGENTMSKNETRHDDETRDVVVRSVKGSHQPWRPICTLESRRPCLLMSQI
jgi:hypothetical protein